MKSKRASMELQDHRRLSMDIMHRCINTAEWQLSKTIHIYVSCINNEVDTLGLIYMLLDHDIMVVVPRCTEQPCELVHIPLTSMDELEPSRHCLMEPEFDPGRTVSPEELDLVISPVLAFDRNGTRLGMGGGYYDTFLRQCTCPKFGLAFGFQEVPQVPSEAHDISLDTIITEHETIRIDHE